MFDLTSSKLLILAVVALIVVGPKDLPALLRTMGRYLGMIRRQANEFRAQFEDAMRDSELADLKKEVEGLGNEARDTLRETTDSLESHVGNVTREVNESLAEASKSDAFESAHAGTIGESTPASSTTEAAAEPDAAVPPQPVAPPAAMPKPVAHSPDAVAEAGEGVTTPTRSGA